MSGCFAKSVKTGSRNIMIGVKEESNARLNMTVA